MPSPRTLETGPDGVIQEFGDWVSHQCWIDQIAAGGGRADLFRQYIVVYGAYERMQRPQWHLTEPNAALRWTATDYAADPQNKRPTYPLPIGVEVEICPN